MLRLTVTDPTGTRTVEVARAEAVVGRREGVDIRIEDSAASRNHCVLRLDDGRVQLIDLGSANGVVIDGKKVTEAVLVAGDQFRIGKTTLRVEQPAHAGLVLEESPMAPPAAAPPEAPVPAPHHPDFAREVRAMLARAPWFAASLVVHALALLLLNLVPFSVRDETPFRNITVTAHEDIPGADTELDSIAPPELERPEDPFDDIIDDPEETALPDPASGEELVNPELFTDPHDVGTGERLTQRISPLSVKPNIKKPGQRLNKGDLASEYGDAKKVVEIGLGTGLRALRGRSKDLVLVVKGDFDKMENVLDIYQVNYTLIDRDRFASISFSKAKVICLNCARKPHPPSKAAGLANRVKRFVNRGGWLISSDWSLEPFITLNWPRHVQKVSPDTRQSDTTVAVEQALHSPLLRGVFARRTEARWWLEESSTFFRIVDPRRTNVLIHSPEAQRKYGAGDVVIEFRSGRGRVLHLLGHFWQEDGTRAGLVGMHRLILNFLLDRFEAGG